MAFRGAHRSGESRHHVLERGDVPLANVMRPEACAGVGGFGWFLVKNVPGLIGEAPVVWTFQLCPEACEQIVDGTDWNVSFPLNTCR